MSSRYGPKISPYLLHILSMAEEFHAAGRDVSSIQWHWSCDRCVSGGLCRGEGGLRDGRAAVSAPLGSTAVALLEVPGRGCASRWALAALEALEALASPSPSRLNGSCKGRPPTLLASGFFVSPPKGSRSEVRWSPRSGIPRGRPPGWLWHRRGAGGLRRSAVALPTA